MNFKRLLLVNSLAVALLGANVVSAETSTANVSTSGQKASQSRQQFDKKLSAEQRTQLQQIRKNMRAQLLPLIKEKRALRTQIKSKMATPNAQWSDVASLVDKDNANNAKIATLVAKTRFETYQKLGILMPLRHHHQCHHVKNYVKK